MLDLDLSRLDFGKGDGLVTVVAQDAATGVVLMIAHADRDALERTLATGEMHYRSRTRGLWHKGATSGNTQRVVSLTPDCDGDAVLARVVPAGPACHTGSTSCFGDTARLSNALTALDATIMNRARGIAAPAGDATPGEKRPSYTLRLLGDRNLRLKKLGEEIAEFVVACSDDDAVRAVEEGADVVYHMAVALHGVGASVSEVAACLTRRAEGGTTTAP